MKEYIGHGHEQVDEIIYSEPIIKVFDYYRIDPSEISHLIQRDHFLSSIIHSDLDVDRMDYLLRDAHYTGVPYGTVDAHRLIQSTILSDRRLILDESGINAAESLLIARTLMRPAVYLHHVSRIAASMLTLAS
jgi:HD superfamily phosphohydrolase